MMIKSVFICVLLVVVSFVAGNPMKITTPPRSLITALSLEESCVRQGGLCLHIEDCPPGDLVTMDSHVLCPKQAHLDVACCYFDAVTIHSK